MSDKGRPAQEKSRAANQTKVDLDSGGLAQGLTVNVKAGGNVLVVRTEPRYIGDLRVLVVDGRGKRPAADQPYRIRGASCAFEGRTKADGSLVHCRIPAGCYELTIGELHLAVPTHGTRRRFHRVYVDLPVAPAGEAPTVDASAEPEGLTDSEITSIVGESDE